MHPRNLDKSLDSRSWSWSAAFLCSPNWIGVLFCCNSQCNFYLCNSPVFFSKKKQLRHSGSCRPLAQTACSECVHYVACLVHRVLLIEPRNSICLTLTIMSRMIGPDHCERNRKKQPKLAALIILWHRDCKLFWQLSFMRIKWTKRIGQYLQFTKYLLRSISFLYQHGSTNTVVPTR